MTSVRDARLASASSGDWCATSATPVPCLPMMLVAVSQPASRGGEAASNKKQATTRRRDCFGFLTKAAKTIIRSPLPAFHEDRRRCPARNHYLASPHATHEQPLAEPDASLSGRALEHTRI